MDRLANRRPLAIVAAVALLGLASASAWAPRGVLALAIDALCLLSLAQMWNLLAGYAGIVSLGQQAFVGVGAYALLLLAGPAGLPPLVAIAGAAVAGALVAVVAGAFVFRLGGSYLAVGTWVVAEAIKLAVSQVGAVGGGGGTTLPVDAAKALAVPVLGREGTLYLLALGVAVVLNAAAFAFLKTKGGLALTAVRDNERAARACGVHSGRLKFLVYVAASAGAALTGAVIYFAKLRISPSSAFDISWTSYVLFIVVIGGLGSIEGPIVGTVVFIALRAGFAQYGSWYLILLGVIAIAAMLAAPGGIRGLLRGEGGRSPLLARLQRRPPRPAS